MGRSERHRGEGVHSAVSTLRSFYDAGGCGAHEPLERCQVVTANVEPSYAAGMDIEAVIAALGDHYDAEDAAIAERMLREYAGTVPDKQLIEEIGLAIAIHRRGR